MIHARAAHEERRSGHRIEFSSPTGQLGWRDVERAGQRHDERPGVQGAFAAFERDRCPVEMPASPATTASDLRRIERICRTADTTAHTVRAGQQLRGRHVRGGHGCCRRHVQEDRPLRFARTRPSW
jgi:hypothetical protein